MASKDGKIFQDSIEASCKKENIFCDRIKDTFIPPEVRSKVPVVKNKYDFYIYHSPYLLPVELKSIQENRVSFSESMIKKHQIDALTEAARYEGVIPGFIFNFRSFENRTFFVHINDFNEYKNVAENEIKIHKYKSKVNKSSIPFGICEEVGIEIKNTIKKVNYHYHIKDFITEVISSLGE